jgi:hypothetical protein
MFNDNVEDALNVHDLRIMAQKRLPKWLFEFVDRGTEDEVALRNNRAAFERIKLKTQVLVDVSNRNQGITLFGCGWIRCDRFHLLFRPWRGGEGHQHQLPDPRRC